MPKMTMDEVARAGRTTVRLENLPPDCMVTAAQVERYVEDRIAALLTEITTEHDALDHEIEKLSEEVTEVTGETDAAPDAMSAAQASPAEEGPENESADASEEATGPIPIADARTE